MVKSTCNFILKRFYSLKTRDTTPFLITSRVIFFLKFRLQIRCSVEFLMLSRKSTFATRGGGGLPYEEYMGVCHELGSHFQEKIPKRVCQFFTKIPERAITYVKNSI